MTPLLPGRVCTAPSHQRCSPSIALAIIAGAAVLGPSAHAQDATWLPTPTNSNYNFADNWAPNTVPTGTAFFAASDTTNLTFSESETTVGGWTFNAGATAYEFNIGALQRLTFDGDGIVVNDGSATINVTNGFLDFFNASTAANATLNHNSGTVTFNDTSTAANATINQSGGFIEFYDNSTAANATMNQNAGFIKFLDSSTAANATINQNGGFVQFFDTSTAANATINQNGGFVQFNDTSTAANAAINVNSGVLDFLGSSTAANATLIVAGPGTVRFLQTSTAGNATINGNFGFLQFSENSTAGNATITNNRAFIQFSGSSTAANATIADNLSFVQFFDNSTAGDANITNSFGFVQFLDNSTAGDATIIDNRAFLQFSGSSTAANATIADNRGSVQFSGNSSAGNANITGNANTAFIQFSGSSTAANATIADNRGFVQFSENSTAGDATITDNLGFVEFSGNSSAGNATVTGNDGSITFAGSSNAANAMITVNGGELNFSETSSAGNATIVNNSQTDFEDSSTAANATITNNGALQFFGNSTAGNADITNNDVIQMSGSASGGDAAIVNNGGLFLNENSTLGQAQILNNEAGIVDLSSSTGPLGDGDITAGSIAGAGNYFLGANQFIVGGNGLSTEVSGVISDCGPTGSECSSPATGGGLVKVGGGALTLSGANTYTGPTSVNGGTLFVNGSVVSDVTVNNGGILGGVGRVGATTLAPGGIVAPGISPGSVGVLEVTGNYHSDSGHFLIDAFLDDGSSQDTDKLIVGGDTSGNTLVYVNNLGGPGGITGRGATDGIMITEIAGSSSGTFGLGEPVYAGVYEYGLFQADGQDWYLQTSNLRDQGVINPYIPYSLKTFGREITGTFYERTGTRIGWRPDVLGTSVFGSSADLLSEPVIVEEIVEEASTRFGVWARILGAWSDADGTLAGGFNDVSYDETLWAVQSGFDAIVSEGNNGTLVASAFLHYGQIDTDSHNSLTGMSAGSTDTDGWGGGAGLTFATLNGLYLDGVATYTSYELDVTAATGDTGSTDGDGWTLSGEAGWRIALGDQVAMTPQAQLIYQSISIDGYTDSAGVTTAFTDADSLEGRLGTTLEFVPTSGDNTARLYAEANLVHEFLDDPVAVVAGTPLALGFEDTGYEVGIGAEFGQNGGGFAAWVEGDYRAPFDSGNGIDTWSATGGVAFRF